MKKKNMNLIIGLIVVAVIAIVASFIVISREYTPEATIEKFTDTIRNKDAAQLELMLISKDKKMKLNKKTVKPLIEYYGKHKEELKEINEELREQVASGKKNPSAAVFTLEPRGKAYGLFQTYKIVIEPRYVEIKTQGDIQKIDVRYSKNKYEFTDKEKNIYGPIVPGTYDMEISYTDPFDDVIENKEKMELIEKDQTISINQKKETLKDKNFQKKC